MGDQVRGREVRGSSHGGAARRRGGVWAPGGAAGVRLAEMLGDATIQLLFASIESSDSRSKGAHMATLTIRGLDDETKARLRVSAARHGRSMEAEVRSILEEALPAQQASGGLGSRI